jgi:hypothetical protein
MKTLNELAAFEVDELAKQPVQARCNRIIDEFDEWLAIRVLRLKLQHGDLPQLNDAFRDYFSDTRTARAPGGSR